MSKVIILGHNTQNMLKALEQAVSDRLGEKVTIVHITPSDVQEVVVADMQEICITRTEEIILPNIGYMLKEKRKGHERPYRYHR